MTRVTEPFRKEHAEIEEHLGFLEGHIAPHARWEERVLYPAVDRRVHEGAPPFTASMRHEHEIVARWINALEREAAKERPDPRAFTRQADALLGLLRAHFEEEEEVLLPILDRAMTSDEYEREIGHTHGER